MSRAFLTTLALLNALAILLMALLAFGADSKPILLAILALVLLLPVVLALACAQQFGRARSESLRRFALPMGALAAAGALVLAYRIGVAYVDAQLARANHGAAYADCHKVWATRGLVEPALSMVASAGNTANTVNRAFARGAPGVEIDVYYDPALADFVVSHDFPYELKDGALLKLDQLLAKTDPTKHYWLDFKRHGQLTRKQSIAAAERLAAIAAGAGIPRPRLWIEGTEPFNLMPFARAGFSIIFDVHPPADDALLASFTHELHKAVYLMGGFTVMGMNYGSIERPIYGPVARQRLGDIPVFLYHVPTDRALLATLARIPQVRVLMAGDHSADVYDINACNTD